ncbi:hypothetical protein L6164_012877 [Bauhinia variegata]|uniref:Uncharacterized protein n=1 Tax=Bauhinia variegata TaxID=167791 RepID=A0ACB9PCN3_BAUVA|nr:hypothetical protein L6164_012877 [Bauhinia variegata]
MADPASSYGNPERDIEQALIALKKGTQLVKYSRKAKPKFCPFRLSPDETTLIWISHGAERNLKLSSVSRIIPGQRTAVFKRYLRPDKDYLSFSLIYNNGDRSLDLICKDKAETEVWFAALKALISSGQHNRRTRSEFSDDGSSSGRPSNATLESCSSINRGRISVDSVSRESLFFLAISDVGSNMQLRGSAGDGFRVSVSSTPSCSSGGSGPDDIESLGDVYIWGEVWADGVSPDGLATPVPSKTDVLVPKALESNVVLDVQQIASGVRHIALVTRQGEVFTWGEDSGGRLGHGIDVDFGCPHLVESLAVTNVEFVACGEYHTCALSTSGDLFTWGDGTHNAGLLGHGTDASHWIPKRVNGPLEGLQVLSIACGTWHSALATSNGKLFTFGDGTFGVLGHGDRQSVSFPKEVQLLSGLKTIKVACGVWHTAAIVEVMGQTGSSSSSRKLFTWGDGDKYRLGHGNRETYLQPTCVSALIEYDFHQVACGHTMTVALTTSGHVFTMGGSSYGQLGNPKSDGRAPILVQDKLVGEFVEEISCGAHHVAVLTSRSELCTWGRGASGRLGHGDIEDRKSPTLVEALKDRHVKNISCGSNFTSCVCLHKWISGADQSVCSGCRQAFGFTRKRHNCYNCGLVHCHACSSKKAYKAALAPTPGKPHRVCDACFTKLKAAEVGGASAGNRKVTPPRRSVDGSVRERIDRGEVRSARVLLPPIIEPIKYLEIRSGKPGSRYESSIVRASQVPSLSQLKDIAFPSSLSAIQSAFKPIVPPPNPPVTPPGQSRPVSPYTRRPSPPRSAAPGFSKSLIDSLRKTIELLNQELSKMQNQVQSLKQKSDLQVVEIHKLQKNVKQANTLTREESSRHTAAKNFIKSIADQLKEMVEKLPPEASDGETLGNMLTQAEEFLKKDSEIEAFSSLPENLESDHQNAEGVTASESDSSKLQEQGTEDGGNNLQESNAPSVSDTEAATPPQSAENGSRPPNHPSRPTRSEAENKIIEQFEPGVYVTVLVLPSGRKVFKGVRFSKRRFNEHQAEEWWNTNKDRVLRRYVQLSSSLSSSNLGSTTSSGAPRRPPPDEDTAD